MIQVKPPFYIMKDVSKKRSNEDIYYSLIAQMNKDKKGKIGKKTDGETQEGDEKFQVELHLQSSWHKIMFFSRHIL